MTKTKSSRLRVYCSCGAWLQVLAKPEEAGLRVLEFAIEHGGCFTLPIDAQGFAEIAYGIEAEGRQSPMRLSSMGHVVKGIDCTCKLQPTGGGPHRDNCEPKHKADNGHKENSAEEETA